jgi:L-amino acid N-acyltransferase YncA
MLLRPATLADIPALVALERTPIARQYVGQWSEERHRATLTGGDARYYVYEAEPGSLSAYAILRGLAESSGAIELKRIVIAAPGQGLGRRILSELIAIAFKELQAHRFFLDVFDDNARARHLYASLGFVEEGTMREAAQRDGQWHNLHLMSMLASEYTGQQSQ